MVVRTLLIDDSPIGEHPLIDFFEPVGGRDVVRDALPRTYVPRISRAMLTPGEWLAHPAHARGGCAPRVDWTRFGQWSEFEGHVSDRRSNLWSDTRRRERRLAREVGPVQLLDDARGDADEILSTCLRWKSAQYARLGVADLFADERNTQTLRALLSSGLAQVAGLYAGDRLVAAHVGLHDDGRFYWWFPTYGSEFEGYSPGRVLLHRLLEVSHARGDSEFDFLWGDEPYKWFYATDTRLLEEAGRPPIGVGLRRVARSVRDRAVRVQRHRGSRANAKDQVAGNQVT
jgi:CelD/BcsL family acetyltransferase involved in cellulose biosynthesis